MYYKYIICILKWQRVCSLHDNISLLAVQCERKPLVLTNRSSSSFPQDFQTTRNKTIGLDYHTSSDESEEDKSSNSSSTKSSLRRAPPLVKDKQNKLQMMGTVIDRVDEEGGRALLDLAQSCQRKPPSVLSSEEIYHSLSEIGTVKSEISDNSTNTQPRILSYPAYMEKISVVSQHSVNNKSECQIEKPFGLRGGHLRKRVLDLPMLSASKRFVLEAPSISTTDVGYLYEISTRLLFATIDWVQRLEVFKELHHVDRYNLLLNKWHALFVLGMAQSSTMFPLSTMLFLANNKREKEDIQPLLRWSTFLKLKDVLMNNFVDCQSTKDIYTHMKIIALFDKGIIY